MLTFVHGYKQWTRVSSCTIWGESYTSARNLQFFCREFDDTHGVAKLSTPKALDKATESLADLQALLHNLSICEHGHA